MTGGGLLSLIAYGTQNVLLSGNPEMTYWYKIFRRYSHYSIESVTETLEGPNELFYTQPIKLRAKIQRVGDLLSELYFTFRIPDIYSKYINPQQRTQQLQYKWSRYIGAAIIQNAGFFVGGQKIQEVDGTYLLAKALADSDTDSFEKWKDLVGDNAELVEPEAGVWAGGTNQTGYPNVFQDPTLPLGAQLNRPSIFGQDITVPLGFWFSQAFSQALPLVGLQYHDCEVQLTLNSIQNLYTILDLSGNRVNPLYKVLASKNSIQTNNPEYVQTGESGLDWRNFATDVGATIPLLNQWNLFPRIQCTYVYLTDEERNIFATQPLIYLYNEITPYSFPGLYTRTLVDLYTHNPISRLLFIQQRSDSQYRNDFGNFTNWWRGRPPFIPTPNQTQINTMTNSSGLLVPQGQIDIIRSIRIVCDGNEIQEEKPVNYFTKITPWKTLTGKAPLISQLPIYNFSLYSPNTQPSGSINASRIKNFQVELDFYPLPASTNYVYNITIYVESLNFFTVESGMGGKKYAI